MLGARFVASSGALELRRKLTILADAAKYDASCASSGSKRATPPGGLGNTDGMGICHSYTPDGRCVSLLKILLTNSCSYDCQYCVNRSSSDIARARFEPAEVVQLTLDFYRRNYIEGLFLSSGVLKSPDHTMEQLVEVARLLREQHRFGGYIHLKAAPGVSRELLESAGRFADRVSINVELPTSRDLQALAPEKTMPQVEAAMRRLHVAKLEHAQPGAFMPAGQSTQMVVGASPATDAEILHTATRLYDTFRLRRVYYSGYSPIPRADQRLPREAAPLLREHRLYQADWLIRHYGFRPEELTDQNLELERDPKLAWALKHREVFPVDLNRAPRELLLRVPGLGVRSVERLLQLRRHRRVKLEDLRRLKAVMTRIMPFVATDERSLPASRWLDSPRIERARPATQLDLFETAESARSGEV
ncbi:MAG TPA: putative DNA modification/repair radical SAM protein [Polyangiaceae bacterium]|nr:putative DNA modification/repair radical SAM protein [Polyangiaceae bacterium]